MALQAGRPFNHGISRGSELVGLFENALIYTTVLRNVDRLIQNKDDSIIIIIASMAIASFLLIMIEERFHAATAGYRNSPAAVQRTGTAAKPNVLWLANLVYLADFLLHTAGNLVVQLTSSLSATLAISVFSSADGITWGFTGALVSLSLLWMMQQIIDKQE